MKFKQVCLDRELRADADGMPVFRRCFQHEVMMTFNDDSGAEGFREWWEDKGNEIFADFYAHYLQREQGVAFENLSLFIGEDGATD